MSQTLSEYESEPGPAPPADDLSSYSLGELIGRPATPPLRIHHILILTAITSVLLTCGEQIRRSNDLGLKHFFAGPWGAAHSLSTAISITLVGLGFSWRRRGYAFFDLPGHWLLLSQSLGIGLYLTIALGAALRMFVDAEISMAPMYAYFMFMQLAVLALNAYAAVKIADSLPRRLYFAFQASQLLLLLLINFTDAGVRAIYLLMYVPLLLLTLAAVTDRVARRIRDWPHLGRSRFASGQFNWLRIPDAYVISPLV